MVILDLEQELSKDLESELNALICANIPVEQFYSKHWMNNFEFEKPYLCPFHNDKNPSFVVGREGWFKCHGCDVKGMSPIGFYTLIVNKTQSRRITFKEARRELYNEYYARALDEKVVDGQRKRLFDDKEMVERLQIEKGWDSAVLRMLKIGITFDGGNPRVTVPVRNKFNYIRCLYYYNAFKFPEYKEKYRMVEQKSAKPGVLPMETGILFPMVVLWDSERKRMRPHVVFTEGVGDTLMALSHDIVAVTTGSTSYKLRHKDLLMLRDREVSIVTDMDPAGRRAATERAEQLMSVGVSSRIVRLPFKDENHTDLSDWMLREGNTAQDLRNLIASTDYYKSSPTLFLTPEWDPKKGGASSKVPQVAIHDILHPKWTKETYQTEAAVVAMSTEPYRVPAKAVIKCSEEDCKEKNCTLKTKRGRVELDSDNPNAPVATFLGVPTRDWPALIKRRAGLKRSCKATVEVENTHVLTPMMLGPLRESGGISGTTQISAYYFGIDVKPNIPYRFNGYTSSHPKDGKAIAMLYGAEPLATTFESFQITTDIQGMLSPLTMSQESDLLEEMLSYYGHMSRSVTGIRGREMMHMAMDIPYYSAVSFEFCGREVRNGSLDVLIIGDTCCGKSEAATRINEFYGFGEVLTGENISYMGLVGGKLNIAKMQCISWGRLAIHDMGLMVLDEAHALGPEVIPRLTDVRSKGICQVSKGGLHGTANARVALVFIANPREGSSMNDYRYGVKAIQGIIHAAADIRRFDYVFPVSKKDVDKYRINVNGSDLEEHRHTRQQCRAHILWARTRRPEDIKFTTDAEHLIIAEAMRLSDKYGELLDLLLAADARIKLARISVAIAARVFSCADGMRKVLVTKACVFAASTFLERIYDSSTAGLEEWAGVSKRFNVVDKDHIKKVILAYLRDHADYKYVLESFLDLSEITADNVEEILDIDRVSAAHVRNALVRGRCLLKRYETKSVYVPSVGFTGFLRSELKLQKTEKEGK